jgi:ribulose-phosphate 3-epimerase
MIEIIPAIMPKTYDQLFSQVAAIVDVVPMVQIDIMDGVFVKDKTWPYNMTDEPNFLSLMREEEELPFADSMNYELDLMVQHPEELMHQWVTLNPKRIVFHLESLADAYETLESVQSVRSYIHIGLAIGQNYPMDRIGSYLPYVDYVQCMGIVERGKQGEPFSDKVLEQLTYLKSHYPHIALSVDGAVNEETLEVLIEAGATRLVVGSAIFNQDDPVDNVQEIQRLVGME